MAQSILITDVLIYSEEYMSYDIPFPDYGSEYQQNADKTENEYLAKTINEVKSYGHEINGQFHYHPRTGTLVLFLNRIHKVICAGIYDAEESMKRGKIILVPGSFFPMNKVDFEYFDYYIDYNLMVNTGYECLFFINEFDIDGCTVAAELIRKGMYNSVLYPTYERMRKKLLDVDPDEIDYDKAMVQALKYEEYNTLHLWEYNIVIAAIKSGFDICYLCEDCVGSDEEGNVNLIPLIVDQIDPETDITEIKDDDKESVRLLINHALLCPYCYHKAIHQLLSEEELRSLRMRTYIDGIEFYKDYYYSKWDYIGEKTPKNILELPFLEKKWDWWKAVDEEDTDNLNEDNPTSDEKIEEYLTENMMMQLLPEGIDPEKYYLPISDRIHTDKRDISEWDSETLLRRAGYTVEKKAALTAKARQRVLDEVINNNQMTVGQVASHIRFQIKLREKRPEYGEAICKWRYDLKYLRDNYSISKDISRNIDDYIVGTYYINGTDNRLYVLYELKNPNRVAVSLQGRILFKGDNDRIVDSGTDNVIYMGPGVYNIMIFSSGSGSKSMTFTLKPQIAKYEKPVLYITKSETDRLQFTVRNDSERKATMIRFTVVFLTNGKVNGFSRGLNGKSRVDLEPGEVATVECDLPHDRYLLYSDGVVVQQC